MGGYRHRSLLLVVVAAMLLTGVSGAAAKSRRRSHPPCSAFFSAGVTNKITGLTVTLRTRYIRDGWPKVSGPNIPDSRCEFRTNDPATTVLGSVPVAQIEVGYGYSKNDFAYFPANENSTYGWGQYPGSDVTAYSVHLGYGSRAWLVKADVWTYWSQTAATAEPGLPHYVYGLYFLTKRHDVMSMFFFNSSAKATQNLARHILLKDTWF